MKIPEGYDYRRVLYRKGSCTVEATAHHWGAVFEVRTSGMICQSFIGGDDEPYSILEGFEEAKIVCDRFAEESIERDSARARVQAELDRLIQEEDMTWEVNDVIQISPEVPMFGGCFMTVTEPKSWGAQGFVAVPEFLGHAFVRISFADGELVGRAVYGVHEP